jgi:hypothetical protein
MTPSFPLRQLIDICMLTLLWERGPIGFHHLARICKGVNKWVSQMTSQGPSIINTMALISAKEAYQSGLKDKNFPYCWALIKTLELQELKSFLGASKCQKGTKTKATAIVVGQWELAVGNKVSGCYEEGRTSRGRLSWGSIRQMTYILILYIWRGSMWGWQPLTWTYMVWGYIGLTLGLPWVSPLSTCLILGCQLKLDLGSRMFWFSIMPYLLDSCVVNGRGGHVRMKVAVWSLNQWKEAWVPPRGPNARGGVGCSRPRSSKLCHWLQVEMCGQRGWVPEDSQYQVGPQEVSKYVQVCPSRSARIWGHVKDSL